MPSALSPRSRSDNRCITVTYSIRREIVNRITPLARAADMSRSRFVQGILQDWLKRNAFRIRRKTKDANTTTSAGLCAS